MSNKDKINEEVVEEVAKTEETEATEVVEKTQEEKLTEELNLQKDKYMRLYAEYDNYRKRTTQEKAAIYSDATAKAVVEMLPIADAVTMALNSFEGKDVPEDFTKGIELIAKGLADSFTKLSVTPFGAVGDIFDPTMHNAVSKIEDENLGENVLSAVYQTGYKVNDKIIRHAMVVVANCD